MCFLLAQPFASRLTRPQNLHTFKAMSFIHELSQTTAQAQRDAAERRRLYEIETERLVQPLVAAAKERFMEACREAARNQKNECWIGVKLSDEVSKRNGGQDLTEQKLRAMLVELGFHDGTVEWPHWCAEGWCFKVSATWPVADAASPKEASPERGTSITCPIGQEHPSRRSHALSPRGVPRLPTLPAASPMSHVP